MSMRSPITRSRAVSRGALLALLLAAPLAAQAGQPAPKAAAAPFSLTIDAPSVKVGGTGTVRVRLAAAPGYHVNRDFPSSLRLAPPAGVDLPKPIVSVKEGGAKIEEQQATFDVVYTARVAGAQAFTGTVSFAVCTATTCDPHREKVAFTVDVK